jgi:[ribosomal protein S5]-alanine N-acetyltransferase
MNFSPFPQLITERLLLRQLSLNDAEEIFALRSNEIVNKHLGRPKAQSIDEAKNFINKINAGIESNQSVYWAICLQDQIKLIGTICLWNFSDEENKAEIGYELLPQFHGKGIMQEAFLKVVEFGFQTLQLDRIEAWTTMQNENSIKILERNNFRRSPELESKIDRVIEGPNTIIYTLSRQLFKQQVAV